MLITILVGLKEKIDKINPSILASLLLLAFLILPLCTYNHTLANGDMAEYINNPLRVINGELPYRDFWLLFPPGEVFLPALMYKIFGLNINILLIFSILITSFVGLFSFILGRLIFQDNFYAAISAMLVFFNGINHDSGFTYIHIHFLMLLLAAFLLIKYLKSQWITYLFLSGILVGFAFIFKIYIVGAAFSAFILTILTQSIFTEKQIGLSIKHVLVFCSGTFLVTGIASVAFIDIWQTMIKEIMIESLSHGTAMNMPYSSYSINNIALIADSLKGAFETHDISYIMNLICFSFSFINGTLYLVLPFFLSGLSVLYLTTDNAKNADKIIIFLFLSWGMLTFPKAMGRSDISHLSHSISPLFFLLIFLLQKTADAFKTNEISLRKLTAYVLGVSTFIFLTPTLYFLVKAVHETTKTHYLVKSEYGTLLLRAKSEAENVNAVIKFIERNTEQGDYIFVTSWYAPPFYALTNRKNPTYYDSLIDLVSRPSHEKQINICEDLLRKRTKIIIHGNDWGFDGNKELQFKNNCPILLKCIEDNFELAAKYGPYLVYIFPAYSVSTNQ